MYTKELLTGRDHLLVALDGPIAGLPSMESTAGRLRVMVADGRLPRKVARTSDPFVVLAYAAAIGPATEQAVHAQLCRIEHELLAAASVTPGVHDALAAVTAAGTQITVITSLATTAVRTFLAIHGLDDHVRHLAGRTGPDRTRLPPAPNLIVEAIRERAVAIESCLFVGSTEIDLAAARAAGVDFMRHRSVPPTHEPPPAPLPPNPWWEALSTPAKRSSPVRQ